MQISAIYVYPIKSTAAVEVRETEVGPRGLGYDRHWALFGEDHEAITARDCPALLALSARLTGDTLEVRHAGETALEIPLQVGEDAERVEVQVFDAAGTGVSASEPVNEWFSAFVGRPCKLVFMSPDSHRAVEPGAGGTAGDVVSFADECPLMMLSEATLETLNAKLERAIPMVQFRPNLVVSGAASDDEDRWRRLRIGECEFEMLNRVQRCVFATIDPDARVPDEQQEPLRTLATYRRHERGGVAFGRHLIARRFGRVAVGDPVEVLE